MEAPDTERSSKNSAPVISQEDGSIKHATDFILFFILFHAIGVVWQLLEIYFYDAVHHRVVDDIMAVLWLENLYWVYNREIEAKKETLF